MKNLKNFVSSFLIVSILSMNAGVFVSPVFAFDKENVNLDTNKDNPLSKISEEGSYIKQEFRERAIADRQIKTDLNKNKIKSLENSKSAERINKDNKNYVEGEVLVKFKEQKINLERYSGRVKARQFATNKNLDKKEDIRKSNISVLGTKENESVESMIERLKNDSNVKYVQPNFQYYPLAIDTNDTHKDKLWGLDNTGQETNAVSGTPNADIDAPEAWAISEGENEVIIAVIDDGVAYNHPDISANMWDGSSCVGLDKNDNPLSGGCNHGYDYEDGDLTPLPTSGSHGTHIAGTIGAVKNNNKGIIGVAPNVKIMAVKSSLTTDEIVKGIDFAENNGAKVINASWGDSFNNGAYYHYFLDQSLYNAIDDFSGLFIAAAGNDSQNHDSGNLDTMMYPAGFRVTSSVGPGLDNIIVVAATDQNDELADEGYWGSDYGVNSVDVGAPGVNIYSTVPQKSIVLFETFETITPPYVPTGFVATADWGTYDLDGGIFWGNVLYGDVNNIPYAQIADSTITSPTYDLSSGGVNIDFWARCDTEYSTSEWTDYMALEISSDGGSFAELDLGSGEGKFDEPLLDSLNGDPFDSSGSAVYHFENISIPSQYSTSNFKFRFRWFANGNTDTGNGDGCLVDDIKITKYTDGSDENYDYSDGTSMAAPHVAGLAGLIWGYKPDLTYAEVKDVILTTGDVLPDALVGKTVTGKRINAHEALLSLTDTTPPIRFNPLPTGELSSGTTEILISLETNENATCRYSTVENMEYSLMTDDFSTTGETIHSTTVTGLTDGQSYNYYVRCEDETGNPNTDDFPISFSVAETINTPPVMESITLDPSPAFTNNDITATAIADDENEDEITFSYQWKKNGENIGDDSDTLSGDNFVKGDVILVIVTPNDETKNGEPMASDTLVVSNSIPTQPTVYIDPSPAYADDDLTCVPDGSTDADNDELNYLYQWYKNDSLQDGYNSNTILSSLTEIGDVWKCEVVANDGTDDSVAGESSVEILEEPDTIPPVVTLSGTPSNPTNQTTTDITVGNAVDTEVVTHYRYKLNEGDYSEIEISVSEHIQLLDLSNGEHTLYVIGRDVAENWQSEASATIHTWTVDIIAPIAEETAPVITPTSDTRPDVGITVEDGASWEIKNVENILETGVGTGTEQIITLPELGEGTYNLILIATDDAGNITTINLSEFIIDLSVSPISLSNLPNNPTSETITDIVVSGDDIVFYKYKLDDDLDYSEEISIDTNIVLSSLSESEHTLSVIGRDEAGNWSDEISETWTIDLTAPNNPVIISPAEAIILNFDTYSITGTAEDGSLVEIYSGVELVGSQQLVIGETVYSIEVDLAQNADNNFTATATDLAGNKSASVIVPTITEDSIAPVVAIISPANGLITNQNPITFNWTVDGEIGSEEIPLTEGENVLTKEAVDEAGNVGSDSIIVILDTIAPILTEIAPVQTTTNNNTPEYIFNSTETGTIIYSGGCASATTDAIAGDNTITFDELDDGTYSECIITVTDAVGNESLPLQVSTFTIDTVAPIIIITSPEDGFITNQSTITIEFTEDGHPGSRDEILSEGENLVVVHGPEDEAGNRGEDSITVILDTIPPVISECMPVYTPTMDSTPDWAFDGEPGIISYSGSCSSVMTEAIQGENTITFNEMEDGVYNDCRIIVTDGAGNPSDLLTISEFTIDNVIPVITLLGSNPVNLYVGDSYEEAGATATDNVGITNEITIDSSAVDTSQTGTYEVSYNVSDNAGNSADEVIRTVIVDEVAVLTITVDPTQTEVVITSNQPTSIIIPDNVTNATINVDSLIADDGTSATATLPGINLNVDTSISETPVEVAILAGTIVSAPTRWNGIINAPKIEVNSSVSVTPDSGYTSTVSSVIEIGYGDTELTFDKAVRFLIPSSAGKYVGYSRSGTFTQITNVCSADTQTAGNALVAGGNCKIDVGSDLVIWTKHFTKFATYTQTAIQSTSPPSGGGGVSDRTAPSISKIEVTSTSTEATIIWKTNESSISWIVYGTSADYGLEEKTTVYTTSHSIKISDLLPGTTYHYQIKSKDRSGNKGEYTDKSFVAGGANVADINNDSKVDKYDFSMMMASWGKAGSNSSDLNNDNKVDKYDFALLMSNWGAK